MVLHGEIGQDLHKIIHLQVVVAPFDDGGPKVDVDHLTFHLSKEPPRRCSKQI